jgi:UDP-N-acetylmuramate dehydrogenase
MKQAAFPVIFQEQVPLAPYTTLQIGGPARYMAEVVTEEQVTQALEFAHARNLPVFILGGGSNLVVSDAGFGGLVIRIAIRGIRVNKDGLITACAGEEWDSFVCRCVNLGLAGIECLSGIPGTVGGTPVQNVGAYGQDISEVMLSVRTLDRRSGQVATLSREECGFGYRTSIFNTISKERYIVLAVSYNLRVNGRPRIDYPDLMRHFVDSGSTPSIAEVRTAILQIRAQKSMVIQSGDPNAKSAGSFFKNPLVPPELADEAEAAARRRGSIEKNGVMPRYPMPDGSFKLSAGWLIEHAGFAKGFRRGRVGLSSKHALALVNYGGATAEELIDLKKDIQSAVRISFGIDLTPEPVFVGFGNSST